MPPKPTPPDLTARYKLKARYAELQRRYSRALETRKDLELEVQEKENKLGRLQDEVDLVIDQIFDSDYVHLRPARTTYFSDEEEGEDEIPVKANGKGKAGGSRKSKSKGEDLGHVGEEEDVDASASEEEGQRVDEVNSRIRKASDDGDYEEVNRAKKVKR